MRSCSSGLRPVDDEHPAGLGWQPLVELLLQLANGVAGFFKDLQGTNDSPCVVGMQPSGGRRIDGLQLAVQPARLMRLRIL